MQLATATEAHAVSQVVRGAGPRCAALRVKLRKITGDVRVCCTSTQWLSQSVHKQRGVLPDRGAESLGKSLEMHKRYMQAHGGGVGGC